MARIFNPSEVDPGNAQRPQDRGPVVQLPLFPEIARADVKYSAGDEYGWHCDQHRTPYPDNRVRKFSFSVFLNEDFDGGEFDLEIHAPNVDVRHVAFENVRPNTRRCFFKPICGTASDRSPRDCASRWSAGCSARNFAEAPHTSLTPSRRASDRGCPTESQTKKSVMAGL